MKRLLYIFALLGVVGTAAAFRGGALPGPAGGSVVPHQNWSGEASFGTIYPAANTVYATYIVSVPSTLVTMYIGWQYAGANGTGTGTVDITDSGGTSLCHINVTCTTITSATPLSSACAVPLPVGTYQLRVKNACGGTPSGVVVMTADISTP